MSALELYYRARYERFRELQRWREHLLELSEAVREVAPEAEAYVFGSAVRGELTAASDVDVLILSDRASGWQRHKLAVMIEERLRAPSVFELHITTKDKLDWYKRHAKELIPLDEITEDLRRPPSTRSLPPRR